MCGGIEKPLHWAVNGGLKAVIPSFSKALSTLFRGPQDGCRKEEEAESQSETQSQSETAPAFGRWRLEIAPTSGESEPEGVLQIFICVNLCPSAVKSPFIFHSSFFTLHSVPSEPPW